jgi:hypothetical protein
MPKKNAEPTHEPVVLREALGQRDGKYDNDEVVSYIVENRNDNKTFEVIADGLKQRGYDSISSNQVSELYNKAIARAVVTHNTANKKFTDFSGELDKMYSQAINVMARLINVLDKIYDEFETSDMETMQKYLMFIKLAPQIKMTVSEIRELLTEYKSNQDKIMIETKNMAMKESDMIEFINKYLKTLEKSGQIKILDPALK